MIRTINSAYYIVVTDGVNATVYPIGRRDDIYRKIDELQRANPYHQFIETKDGARLVGDSGTIQITVITTIR